MGTNAVEAKLTGWTAESDCGSMMMFPCKIKTMKPAKTWSHIFQAGIAKKKFANDLTVRMTKAESLLWEQLRKVNKGPRCRPICAWKPQVIIKGWIVDFYNADRLLAIEVDGSIHQKPEQKAKDRLKDSVLSQFGIRVLRVANDEVLASPVLMARRINGYSE